MHLSHETSADQSSLKYGHKVVELL
jgi:hypothetical protein